MCGAQTPGATAYIGSCGKDKFGEQMKAACAKDGVNVAYYEDDAPTGTCAVAVLDGERSLCANLSAANNYKVHGSHTPAPQPALRLRLPACVGLSVCFVRPPSCGSVPGAQSPCHGSASRRVGGADSLPCQSFTSDLPPLMNDPP